MKENHGVKKALETISMRGALTEFRKKFTAAVPVIIFFLILFYTVVLFFGTQYALVVSFVTAAFKVRMQKKCTVRSMLNLFFVQLLLCVLAFLATVNLVLCVLLNIAVPFVLIYLQTTQFNQKGYFTNAMEFVFLQLRPVGWEGFLPLMGVMVYASVILIAALTVYSLSHRKVQDYSQARKGLSMIAQEFARIAEEGEYSAQAQKDMLALQASLHRLAYGSRNFSYVVRGEGKIHYMFALLFQRTSYYISDFAGHMDKSGRDTEMLKMVSSFLVEAGKKMNATDNTELVQTATELSFQTENLSERSAVFMRNFLRLLILIMESVTEAASPAAEWKLPKQSRPLGGLRHRLRLDSFEVRFALRLSLVSTISFVVCRLTNSDHSYWLPLNAFILLQPMYEESAYRMKTRLVGTSIGCLIVFLVLPVLPGGVVGHFLFATVMITLMYCSTPGTWVQPIFATGFALTLASMTMSGTTAIELRIFYLILSVLLVLVVNRFFFPNSRNGQFRCNIRELYNIQNSYLTMLSISTRRTIDYGAVCDALISFHLIYDEVRKYLANETGSDAETYVKILSIMWKMVAEAEQMILCTRKESLTRQTRAAIDRFSWEMKHRLRDIRRLPPVKRTTETGGPPAAEAGQPYIDYLMKQYESNLQSLGELSETLPAKLLQ